MANICSATLAGIELGCESNIGGIRRLWLANYHDVTVTSDAGVVTNLAMKTEVKFKPYELWRNLSDFSFTQADSTNGNVSFDVTLNAIFPRMNKEKRVEMEAITKAPLMAIVQDSNGLYWVLGTDEGLRSNGSTGQTGVAKSDSNQYQMVLTESAGYTPMPVEEDVVKEVVEQLGA